MWRFASILLIGVSLPTVAADMSVDQAVSRLLKDIETEVEVLRVPVPASNVTAEKGAGSNTNISEAKNRDEWNPPGSSGRNPGYGDP